MSAAQKPERQAGTAVAPRKEQRAQMDAFRSRLDRLAPQMQTVLPKYLTPERVVTLALTAATKNPALLECTVESVALAMMQLAQSGLELGRTAYLVPFNDRRAGKVCTFIPSWQGLIQLIVQSRHVKDVKARAVYANEHFIYEEGANPRLEHIVNSDPAKRGEIIGFYAVAFFARTGSTFEFMSKQDVDRIRSGAPSKDSPAWRDHYVEMGKKTVIRRLAKRLPQSTAALASALESDAEFVELSSAPFMANQSARAVEGGPQQSRLMISASPDDPYVPNDAPSANTEPEGAPEDGDDGSLRADEGSEGTDFIDGRESSSSQPAATSITSPHAFVMPFTKGGTAVVGTKLADVTSKDLKSAMAWAQANQSGKFMDFVEAAHLVLDDRRNGDAAEPGGTLSE